jgi:hypothetical protein
MPETKTREVLAASSSEIAAAGHHYQLIIFESEYWKNPAYPEPEYPAQQVVIPKLYVFHSEHSLEAATRAAKAQGKTCVSLMCTVLHLAEPERIEFK